MLHEPIRVLELVDRRFPALFSGKKRDTIRWNEGDVQPGFLVYVGCDNKNLKALVWVTETMNIPLRDVPANSEEIPVQSPDDLLSSMKRHYPEISLDTEILLVKHLTPLDTIRRYAIPAALNESFDAEYIQHLIEAAK